MNNINTKKRSLFKKKLIFKVMLYNNMDNFVNQVTIWLNTQTLLYNLYPRRGLISITVGETHGKRYKYPTTPKGLNLNIFIRPLQYNINHSTIFLNRTILNDFRMF
jgi:hypothetical protein